MFPADSSRSGAGHARTLPRGPPRLPPVSVKPRRPAPGEGDEFRGKEGPASSLRPPPSSLFLPGEAGGAQGLLQGRGFGEQRAGARVEGPRPAVNQRPVRGDAGVFDLRPSSESACLVSRPCGLAKLDRGQTDAPAGRRASGCPWAAVARFSWAGRCGRAGGGGGGGGGRGTRPGEGGGDKEGQGPCFLLVADLHLNQTLVMFGGSFINF